MCTFPDSFLLLFYFFLNVIESKYILPPVDYRCISENVLIQGSQAQKPLERILNKLCLNNYTRKSWFLAH